MLTDRHRLRIYCKQMYFYVYSDHKHRVHFGQMKWLSCFYWLSKYPMWLNLDPSKHPPSSWLYLPQDFCFLRKRGYILFPCVILWTFVTNRQEASEGIYPQFRHLCKWASTYGIMSNLIPKPIRHPYTSCKDPCQATEPVSLFGQCVHFGEYPICLYIIKCFWVVLCTHAQ